VPSSGGTDAVRVLDGQGCDEVARSLAVLVALELEPHAATLPPDDPPEPEAPQPEAPALVAPPRPLPPPVDAKQDDDTFVAPRPRWRAGVSTSGLIVTGMTGTALALAGYLEIFHETPDVFAPDLRLGVEFAWGSTLKGDLLRALFRLDLCPFRFAATKPWSHDAVVFQLCARADAGRYWETDSTSERPVEGPWLDAGGVARVRWANRCCFVETEGSLAFPFARRRFFEQIYVGMDPSPVYEVPRSVGGFGVTTGAYFP
jgi:hypothetical protein